MTTSTLVSLAILKVNWDRLGKDYIENFVPFVVESARLNNDDAISLPQLHDDITRAFGLKLPHNALRQIIRRATKRGYFRLRQRTVYKVHKMCESLDFNQTRNAVDSIYNRVVSRLCEYANNTHRKTWSADDADQALLDFLSDRSLSLLYDIADGTSTILPSPGDRFVVASFVENARVTDLESLDGLATLARGNLLANAMYLPDPGHIQRRFRKTAAYLDTSLIVFATGFAGPHRAAPCIELLELLVTQGAELRCFQGTRNEIQGVLDACAERLRSGDTRHAYGPTMEYFIETGRTASDLELMSARLPAKLSSLGITVVDRPSFERSHYQVDEKGFEDYIENVIGYSNPAARIHDVDCISAIARYRQGRESSIFEECGAIFVTENTPLARATRGFFQVDSSPGSVALAVTDYALANVLWLKDPTLAPDLPRRQLIAESYAAMHTTTDVWRSYLKEIARLEEEGEITNEDYYLLRHSLSAKASLMDLTDGNDGAFTEGTVPEILELAKEKIRADLEEDIEAKRKEVIAIEDELRKKDEESLSVRRHISRVAETLGLLVSRGLTTSFFLLMCIAIGWTFPWQLPAPPGFVSAYVVPSLLVLLLFLTAGNLVWGVTVKSLLNQLADRLVSTLTRMINRLVGLS